METNYDETDIKIIFFYKLKIRLEINILLKFILQFVIFSIYSKYIIDFFSFYRCYLGALADACPYQIHSGSSTVCCCPTSDRYVECNVINYDEKVPVI